MCNSETIYEKDSVYFFMSNMTHCSYCGASLFISYHTKVKIITTLQGKVRAKQVVKECTNKNCTSKRKRKSGYFYAEEFITLTLPHCSIGTDITLYIGFHMHIKKQSLDEVHSFLLQRNCQLDRSTVFRHYEKYLKLMSELSDQEISDIKKGIKRNAGYILSIDAVHSIDSPLLLVCRDTITKKILGTKLILTENEIYVTELLTEVKETFGDPMAIVSDMGHGINKGIENVFPGIKHQYCQFHFLKNLGKDLLEEQYKIIQLSINNSKKK